MLRPGERRALEQVDSAVLALGDDGRIGFATTPAQKLLGWDGSLVGQSLSAIVPQRLRSRQQAGYQQFVMLQGRRQQGGIHRHPALCRDGSERPLQIEVVAFHRPDGSMFMCAALADDAAPPPGLGGLDIFLGADGYRRL